MKNGCYCQFAQTGPGEHCFGYHRAGQEACQEQSGVGKRWDYGVSETVLPNYTGIAHPFGACELYELGVESFQHRRAN